MNGIGISGKIAKSFIKSKLTPLIVIASLLLGIFAVIITPREEEPQIVVPMVDVFVQYPGASAKEVEERVTRPMERLISEIKGVEYVYSIVRPGMNLTIVRFYVGENMEDSLVKLYNKLMSNYDMIPPGVSQPLVKPKSIDDVPVLALTLWSTEYSGYELRRIAEELRNEIKKIDNVSETSVIGGRKRQIRITPEPEKLRAYNLPALQMVDSIGRANFVLPSGEFRESGKEFTVETGGFLSSAEEVGSIVVSTFGGRPVYLKDVAKVEDTSEEPSVYVFMGFGPASRHKDKTGLYEAVTIAISKKKGANATRVAKEAISKVEALKGFIIPKGVEVEVTRNYGETAKEKSDELLEHMLIATISVIVLIALALGWRESIVVAVAVPVTLALTLLVNYLYGYTLNRVTLFALIFSIGILVDDAIVVVENIHRHFKLHRIDPLTAVLATDEVGNPTILATFTVIAAILPMAFVSGLMGPYMRPIPIGASAAMLFSLLVAFIVSPWMSYLVLKNVKHHREKEREGGFLYKTYERMLSPLIEKRTKRLFALGVVTVLLGGAMLLVPLKKVAVKMLPFDNKSELQIVVDMPDGSPLEDTSMVLKEMGEYLKTVPEVENYQIYAGTSAPYNFNGLVRHYFLRRGGNLGDIQVNFVPKGQRKAQSHDIAKRLRPELKKIADRYGASLKIAEIPPGPPVLSTLVAEIYGPDPERQRQIAQEVKKIFESTDSVVDVDWYVEEDKEKLIFEIDKEKAAQSGVSTDLVAKSLRVALSGMPIGLAHMKDEKEPVEIFLRMPESERSGESALKEVSVPSQSGRLIPLGELVKTKKTTEDKTIYHKNLKRVTYVIADVAGTEESPVYAILKMKDKIQALKLPEALICAAMA